jgi:dienelactone hydrolase
MAKVNVTIEDANGDLAGNLFVPQEPNGSAALFVHGLNSHGHTNIQYARLLGREGVTALTFDLSGHGNSKGEFSELSVDDQLGDVRRAYDFLAGQQKVEVDPERIGIAGMSYGGYLATLATKDRAVKSLLLRSPPLYPERLHDKPRALYNDSEALYAEVEADNPALVALREYGGKVVLVVAEDDGIVLPRVTDAYRDAMNNGSYVVLEGARHILDKRDQETFRPLVVGWTKEL